jgi:translocation protein SEC63
MSENFKENFFRDEEQQLDYDDSAFYYFFISILTLTVIPYSLYLLRQMICGEKRIDTLGKNCECTKCKQILKNRKSFYRKTWMRFGFFFKLFFCAFLWYIWYLTAVEISMIEPLKSFDPY